MTHRPRHFDDIEELYRKVADHIGINQSHALANGWEIRVDDDVVTVTWQSAATLPVRDFDRIRREIAEKRAERRLEDVRRVLAGTFPSEPADDVIARVRAALR